MDTSLMSWKDKALFTPGPLTTSRTVKQAMLRDLGSRDAEFIGVVRDIRRRLVALSGADEAACTAVLMQGSGTFALEAVIGSVIPADGRLLVIVNGAYGRRLVQIAAVLRIAHTVLTFPENTPADPDAVAAALAADPDVTHVALVHCETTTGLLNPVTTISQIVAQARRSFIVDAMSSFGGVPLNLAESEIDFLVTSSNKCVEGVPGFGIVLARRTALVMAEGRARSLSLDLVAQWRGLEADGQFRFTPPTHALLAFDQALRELQGEGGVPARAARYRRNYETLVTGMRALGFREYLAPEHQGPIITSFHYPAQPEFQFEAFYTRLSEKGHVIYPGKLSQADCFRIGSIGRLGGADVRALLAAIRETLTEMGLPVPLA